MKRIMTAFIILIVGLGLSQPYAWGQEQETPGRFSISAGAGMRTISDDDYKDVYDGSIISLYLEAEAGIMKSLKGFLRFNTFSTTGETTFTLEETTLKMTAVEAGPRYLFKAGKKLFPYIGAGAGYYMTKEDNPIGEAKENKLGFFGEGGVRFYAMKSLFIDAKFKYVFLDLTHTNETTGIETEAKLGGFAISGGIGYTF